MLKYPVKFERVATTFKEYDTTTLPDTVDLRDKCPPVFDQENLESCTADTLISAYQFNDQKFNGSRLFLHYNERFNNENINEDDKLSLSNSINVFKKYGVCQEQLWPYVDDGAKYKTKPSQQCYTNALPHRMIIVNNIDHNLSSMKHCLVNGNPFVLGMMIYSSFESEEVEKTGNVSIPDVDNEQFLGGHAVLCVGYDNTKEQFIMRNSFGSEWGDNGYFYVSYEYLTSLTLTTDLWEIKKLEIPPLPKLHPRQAQEMNQKLKNNTRNNPQQRQIQMQQRQLIRRQQQLTKKPQHRPGQKLLQIQSGDHANQNKEQEQNNTSMHQNKIVHRGRFQAYGKNNYKVNSQNASNSVHKSSQIQHPNKTIHFIEMDQNEKTEQKPLIEHERNFRNNEFWAQRKLMATKGRYPNFYNGRKNNYSALHYKQNSYVHPIQQNNSINANNMMNINAENKLYLSKTNNYNNHNNYNNYNNYNSYNNNTNNMNTNPNTNNTYVPITKISGTPKQYITTSSGRQLQIVDTRRMKSNLSKFFKKKSLHYSRPIS
jgi:Papain family cysteine protease